MLRISRSAHSDEFPFSCRGVGSSVSHLPPELRIPAWQRSQPDVAGDRTGSGGAPILTRGRILLLPAPGGPEVGWDVSNG